MHALLYPCLAVLAWTAAGYRLTCAAHRRSATPAQHAVTSAFALLAVTFTVSTPTVWVLAERVTGVNNIAALVAHLCVIGFSTTVQILLLWWANPADVARRKGRQRLGFLAAVAIALPVLFVTAGRTESHTTDFVATYAGRPHFAIYLLAYLAAFSTGLVDVMRICWAYSRLVGRGSLRTGLRTAATGAAIGLIYCFARALDIVGAAAGWDVHRWEPVIPLTASSGALLIIAGLTMPAWAPRIASLGDTARQVRLLRRLHPLWTALHQAVPTVRLAADARPRFPWRAAERLHRRVVEIYDARLVLRPYLNEVVGEEARRRGTEAGLRGDALEAVVEAAKLKAALLAMRDGVRPRRPELPVSPVQELDEVREVEQLARVADAFTYSALVAAVVHDLRTVDTVPVSDSPLGQQP